MIESKPPTHPQIGDPDVEHGVADLNADLVDDGIDGACHCRIECEEIWQRGGPWGKGTDASQAKVAGRDHKDSGGDENDSDDPHRRKDFSNEQSRPDLRKERGRAGDGVDQGEVGHPVGLDEADKIDGLDEARSEGDSKDLGGELTEEKRKITEPGEKR